MDREVELQKKITQFNLKKAEVRAEVMSDLNEIVEARLYDEWLEIHELVNDLVRSGVPNSTMRRLTKAYNNPGRYQYWRDSRERPKVDLPTVDKAPEVVPEQREPEMTVKDINRRHRDDNGRDYEVTYEGKTYLMSVREPDGLFVPEATVSNNYDRVSNGDYASMYEEIPRKDHGEFLKKVRGALEDAGLW